MLFPENGTTYTNYFRTKQDAEALLNNLEQKYVDRLKAGRKSIV